MAMRVRLLVAHYGVVVLYRSTSLAVHVESFTFAVLGCVVYNCAIKRLLRNKSEAAVAKQIEILTLIHSEE